MMNYRDKFYRRVKNYKIKNPDKTYEEIGKRFGITRQRAFQIVNGDK